MTLKYDSAYWLDKKLKSSGKECRVYKYDFYPPANAGNGPKTASKPLFRINQ